jgi:hypothetical protein
MRTRKGSAEAARAAALAAWIGAACAPASTDARDEAPADATAPLRAHIAELERELAAARDEPASTGGEARCAELALEVERLQTELACEHERRVEREREWLRYQQALSRLAVAGSEDAPRFEPDLPREEIAAARAAAGSDPVAPDPARVARLERSEEIARSLRAMLAVEGVRGIDLLDAGALDVGWIGPVVFRLLDERGRLAGSLFAERLRLEASRAGRTLTIVLEEGYESRGGVRVPFAVADLAAAAGSSTEEPAPGARATRRIDLTDTDPMPWVSAMPELFGSAEIAGPLDDGVWDLARVAADLNRLLREDSASGYWRVKALGGVVGGVLREVHLEAFDAQGKIDRRVFADRMSLLPQARGILLLLEDGVHVRGETKSPFLEGRFRIFLPRASVEAWQRAKLPGLADPERSGESARESD